MNDDHLLAITGKVYIPQGLENDTSYQFTGEITTYGKDSRSNQDGTFKHTYKGQFSDSVSLIKGDTVVIGEKAKSYSQKQRKMIYARGHDYEEFMRYLFSRMEDIFYDYETR